MTCVQNIWINYSFSIIFQVVLIGIFLILFFFFLVTNVESEEFDSQLQIIIDTIVNPNVVNEFFSNVEDKEQAALLISGSIAVAETKTQQASKNTVKEINCNNNIYKNISLNSCWIAVVVIIIFVLLFWSIGYCMPWYTQLKEALWIVLFIVGLTEIVFLELIAKNYISASPDSVRLALSEGITNYLNSCCDDELCTPCDKN
tara:strand:+ start:1926 stop:2531 length:606 start_codon:yes stop_codon:yes gene_type:complete